MLKIVTVCGAGVGSSLMLKIFVQQILDQKEVDVEVTASDISSVDPHAYDALITASAFADLLDPMATRIIRIDNMLDKAYLRQQLDQLVADIAGSDPNS